MKVDELNFIRAIKDGVIYLILMLKFDRPPFSIWKPLLDFAGDFPHKRTFDSFVLRRALAQEPLNEV